MKVGIEKIMDRCGIVYVQHVSIGLMFPLFAEAKDKLYLTHVTTKLNNTYDLSCKHYNIPRGKDG